MLTNEIYKGWSDIKASEYKTFKSLRKESLRDNMTDIEIALTNIGEIAASGHPQGLSENINVDKRSGKVAKGARLSYEQETKKSALSNENALNYKYIDERLLEDKKDSDNMTRYDESGININTYKLLYGTEKDEIDISDKNIKMLMTIDTFTKILHKKLIRRIIELNKVKNIGIELDNIKYNKETNMYEYIENDLNVPFKMFSDQIIYAPKGVIKELESDNRKGKCHQRSMEISLSFENSKILTGIIHFGKHKSLHSVLLTNDGNIIDWTRNMITDKDTFYKIYDFILINEVDPLYLDNDIKILEQLDINSKVYLTFRDELMRDIELNKNLFDEVEKKHK